MSKEIKQTPELLSETEKVAKNLYERDVITRFKAAVAQGNFGEVDNLMFSMEVMIQDKPFRSITPDILTAMIQGRVMIEREGKETFWFIVNGLLSVYRHVE